jgi:two-component system response regulator AtoC
MEPKRILVIDDEESICRVLHKHLHEKGYVVECSLSGDAGLEKCRAFHPQIVILDIRLPDGDGLTLLKTLREQAPESSVIIITAFGDMQTTITAMQRGAYDYLRKPIDIDELDTKVAMCARTIEERAHPWLVVQDGIDEHEFHPVIGNSRKLQEVFKIIGSVSNSRTTVLIHGESGTGKELVARAIHYSSASRRSPFIAINCGVLVETLLASELFGHEKGAFTGAIAQKKGKFEIAGDGTIFLDEINEMTVANQVKLLRVLQEREFERVGGNETLRSNARIIAATVPPLEALVCQGKFREDLFYRLKVVTIHLPPLRERKEDIPSLVEYFVKRINRELNKAVVHIPEETMHILTRQEWRGNVRELENTIRQALVMCKGDTLLPEFLTLEAWEQPGEPRRGEMEGEWKDLASVEAEYIRHVLEHTGWNKTESSRILNISRPTLDRKIREYKLAASGEPSKV